MDVIVFNILDALFQCLIICFLCSVYLPGSSLNICKYHHFFDNIRNIELLKYYIFNHIVHLLLFQILYMASSNLFVDNF